MRLIARTALVAAMSGPLALASLGPASAAEPTAVSYAFALSGSTVTNTITNNAGSSLTCSTSLAPAPGGVLPPVEDVLRNGQTLYTSGEAPSGVTTRSVTEIPDGTYVVLATCTSDGTDAAMWVSDYPGIEETLRAFPTPAFTVQQASPVITIPGGTPPHPAPGILPDLRSLFGSGSAK